MACLIEDRHCPPASASWPGQWLRLRCIRVGHCFRFSFLFVKTIEVILSMNVLTIAVSSYMRNCCKLSCRNKVRTTHYIGAKDLLEVIANIYSRSECELCARKAIDILNHVVAVLCRDVLGCHRFKTLIIHQIHNAWWIKQNSMAYQCPTMIISDEKESKFGLAQYSITIWISTQAHQLFQVPILARVFSLHASCKSKNSTQRVLTTYLSTPT